jgi:alkylation response protein AidB-like acyl-CoA dehydrogenase
MARSRCRCPSRARRRILLFARVCGPSITTYIYDPVLRPRAAKHGVLSGSRSKRIGTALGKYWICKRAAPHAAEALECLGGNGYVEESIMPRLVSRGTAQLDLGRRRQP